MLCAMPLAKRPVHMLVWVPFFAEVALAVLSVFFAVVFAILKSFCFYAHKYKI
jgi:hypothetical protein